MVPFLKASAEASAQKTKTFADDMKKMTLFTASNDDKYHQTYYGAETIKAANE